MSATPDSTLANPEQRIADLQSQLAECRAERDEALAERTTERDEALAERAAIAEVLQVINSSPGDLAPVFQAILEKAHILCGAAYGVLLVRDGEEFRLAAAHGEPRFVEAVRQVNPRRPPEGSPWARLVGGERIIHMPDARADDFYRNTPAPIRRIVDTNDIRTVLFVPLRKDGSVLGVITAFRQEVRPFTDKQIALLESFAAQAVIAMENARLITETREALEQQTATAEVLQIINSSPGDLAPVFDAILAKAQTLCDAAYGSLGLYDGERFRAVAVNSVSEAFAERLREGFPAVGTAAEPLLHGAPFVHTPDLAEIDQAMPRMAVESTGARTRLAVPLRKDNVLLGIITAVRQEVRPFTDKQIALLQNFAAQAVIAMENARLLTETREALEQQTATTEVLQVINAAPGDLVPVFDAMLDKAIRLCEAAFGILWSYDGDRFHPMAFRNVPPAYAEFLREPHRPGPSTGLGRVASGEAYAHIADMLGDDAYRAGDPVRRAGIELAGARTHLSVPLRKDGVLVGNFAVFRTEVRPFSDKQIVLVQNFAAQAVIAMENARLLTETREALDQQTATAEVLGVINSSPGDLAPVFDSILDKAHSLCGAAFGSLGIFEGDIWRAVVQRGYGEPLDSRLRQGSRGSDNPFLQSLLDGDRLVHIPNLAELDYPIARANVEAGIFSLLLVPLRNDDRLLGTISTARREARPFSDKQIALLRNFAAQAVIAMENARLLTETREALEQQTATAEVLGVINSSPGDLSPVFDAILEKAHSLCGATKGALVTYDGEHFRAVATRGLSELSAGLLRAPQDNPPGSPPDRLLHGENLIHVPDFRTLEFPIPRALVEHDDVRTALFTPLRKDSVLLGYITAYRLEVRPFTEKQIALLQNFAAQAVIAMENARLLGELRERTADLEESLEYQTATSDVLQVISRSTFDLQPILDTLSQTAAQLCLAEQAYMTRREGDAYRFVTAVGSTPEAMANATRFKEGFLDRHAFVPGRESITGRVASEGRAVQIIDVAADPEYKVSEIVTLAKIRTLLGVPMLRAGEPIGTFSLARQRIEPFSERQIDLVRTFADQAVIAIENTRLLTELRESLEQQQAMAQVLQVINSSPGELQPVFDAMLANAVRLCDCVIGGMFLYEDGGFRSVAMLNVTPEFAEIWRRAMMRLAPTTALARLARTKEVIQIDDLLEYEGYTKREALHVATVEVFGARTVVAVPMLKEDELLGAIVVFRREPRSFTDKQLALVSNFASQAVIAIDNARLLNEIRQRQAELRVTFDNMGDGVVMFDADLRLAAWNLNLQQILDLPEAFLAERPSFADYFRYLADRGEFASADLEAQLARTIEDTEQELRFERTRPDGRIIEVRRNAVPGGGFVMIYSDVTERKRAEAEIRAARVSAEGALRELKATQASLMHAEKMASLGQLTAGIAHEIKNPLNFVNNFAGLSVELLDELKGTVGPAIATLDENGRAEVNEVVGMLTGNLEKIVEHGKRADGIVTSMLEHSRGSSSDRRSVDLNGLVEEALNLAYHGGRAQDQSFNVTLERDYAAAVAPIELVPQDITRVCLNLIGNGFYATTKRQREGGDKNFKPTLKVSTRDLGDVVEVRIRDNGTGIAPEHRDRLFQPFFTTKPTGEGTGLGLSISYDIVTQQHGGMIAVDSTPGEFAEFTIRLPRTFGATIAEAAS